MKPALLITFFLTLSVTTAVAAADAKAGKTMYDKSCKACHGATGAANPNIAKMMKVDMRDLSSSDVQSLSDSEMKRIITDGQGKMKPIKSVAGKDLDNVIAYVRTLKK